MPTIVARRILTADGLIGPAEVQIENGILAGIRPVTAAPDITLAPGFIDVQVNGIDDIDVAHASGDDWDRLGELLLDQGVTSWCPTLVTNALDRFAAPLARMTAAKHDGNGRPTIIGAHLEGPFLGGAPGAHNRDLLAPIDLDWLRRLPPIVRLVTLSPELALAAEATRLLVDRGVVVSIGHSTPSLLDVSSVIAAGATMVTHLFNGMSGVHHREPGLAAFALVLDPLAVGLIADLVHVHPFAIQIAFRSKPDGAVVLVTDAVGWRAGEVGNMRLEVRDGAPRLPDGTLAGSSAAMDECVRNVVNVCGVPLDVALRAASTNPARVMGCTDRGAIAVGMRADLVALDAALGVAGVWLAGEQVRPH